MMETVVRHDCTSIIVLVCAGNESQRRVETQAAFRYGWLPVDERISVSGMSVYD